jgi:hypothetical protein
VTSAVGEGSRFGEIDPTPFRRSHTCGSRSTTSLAMDRRYSAARRDRVSAGLSSSAEYSN